MGPWTALLVAYLLGGVTFVPLLIGIVLLHAHYTLPFRPDMDVVPDGHPDSVVQDGDDTAALDARRVKERGDKHNDDDDGRSGQRKNDSDAAVHELDVAAGYFAVCREYTPMGINAKPIERATPVGTATVAPPSPSVYQTFYRSIFDRKPVPGPIENNSMSHRPRKAGNVFYVVLRHGHIMLFDDEEQLEVRHVISLAHYDISIYSGGDETPEGELFIKRNALRLSRREGPGGDDGGPVAKPFYLFSENCSAKEDFYFALLRNQEQTFPGLDRCPPKPKHFDIKDIITLVQRLHSSEETVHSRWINAVLGRIFLSVYRTKDIENFIATKITKKISRVKTPSYLTNIAIRKIDTGEAAPFLHNLKLKEFTVDGECVVEADLRYSGQFRLEMSATAKIDLGARIKAREVNLVLALVLRRIEGHVLFKIKAPPSNRLWLSFQAMPKMELAIEPIVSSRQITYTVILRQIENRIKEVFAETLVQPFWDDVPFFRTEHKEWRGGIFEGDDAVEGEVTAAAVTIPEVDGPTETVVVGAGPEEPAVAAETQAPVRPVEKSQTMPTLESQATPATGLFGRRIGMSKLSANNSPAAASTVSLDAKSTAATTSSSRSPNIIKRASVEPIVGTEAAHADWFKPSTSPPDHATSLIAALHSKAQQEAAAAAVASPSSPVVTPIGSPGKDKRVKSSGASSVSSKEESIDATEQHGDGAAVPPTRRNTVSSHGSLESQQSPNGGGAFSQAGSLGRKFFMKRENSSASVSTIASTTDTNGPKQQQQQQPRNNTLAAVTNAANQARQWGWNAIQRQKDARRHGEAAGHVDLSQPMGRGQPLPPPGTPLPGPTNGKTKIAAPVPVPKRKPVPVSAEDKEPERPGTGHSQKQEEQERELKPPSLPQRRRRGASQAIAEEKEDEDGSGAENILVISAPDDSQPPTPLDDGAEYEGALFGPGNNDKSQGVAAAGIPRRPVPVPIAVVKDVNPEADKTPVVQPARAFDALPVNEMETATLPAQPDVNNASIEDLEQEDGKPLIAMPPSTTTPPEPNVDDDDDDGFAGWMDEDADESLVPTTTTTTTTTSRTEETLPRSATSRV
ncbi:hypothetical protein MY4824_003618 [Beauveria thailandica]